MKNVRCFFGAANGYSGFRSNFDRIFRGGNIKKLFIIKGGPGTGKSTLMRMIAERYHSKFDTTVILCSSDPKSLDGVLIHGNGKTVAIVDGTAPHILEAQYPGVLEDIINLGDAFDSMYLASRRDEIFEATNDKTMCFKHAYHSLGIAGQIHRYILSNLLHYECYNQAERLIKDVLYNEKADDNACVMSDFMIGSFSKNGYDLKYNFSNGIRVVGIENDGILGYVLMSRIAFCLSKNNVGYTLYPSAFSPDLIDAIETNNTLYILSNSSDFTVNTSDLKCCIEDYDAIKGTYDYFLEEARKSLQRSSEYHFMLESVYSKAVDFCQNEKKYEGIVKAIYAILINNVD